MIKKIIILIIIIGGLFSLKIIFFSKKQFSNTGLAFHLTKNELVKYKEQAYKGDINAIMRLDEFYSLSKNNTEEGLKWLILAVKLYDVDTLHNYMKILKISDNNKKILKLIEWLKKEAIDNNAYAQRELYYLYKDDIFIDKNITKSNYWLEQLNKNLHNKMF